MNKTEARRIALDAILDAIATRPGARTPTYPPLPLQTEAFRARPQEERVKILSEYSEVVYALQRERDKVAEVLARPKPRYKKGQAVEVRALSDTDFRLRRGWRAMHDDADYPEGQTFSGVIERHEWMTYQETYYYRVRVRQNTGGGVDAVPEGDLVDGVS